MEIARLERVMADHQLEFRANPEPQQAEKLLTKLLEMTADPNGGTRSNCSA